MKVAVSADHIGTRISEESHLKPELMIEIGYQPIFLHITYEHLPIIRGNVERGT